jgi:hypothetical protein
VTTTVSRGTQEATEHEWIASRPSACASIDSHIFHMADSEEHGFAKGKQLVPCEVLWPHLCEREHPF